MLIPKPIITILSALLLFPSVWANGQEEGPPVPSGLCSNEAESAGLALFRHNASYVSPPKGPLGAKKLYRLFWKPLAVLKNGIDTSTITIVNESDFCEIPDNQLTHLPTRLFIVPHKTDANNTVAMVTIDAAGQQHTKKLSTPTAMPMPPTTIMPYPLIKIDTNGFPAVLGPFSENNNKESLITWTIQTNTLPIASVWVLLQKEEVADLLFQMGSHALASSAPPAPPVPDVSEFVAHLICPTTNSSTQLLSALGYDPEKRVLTQNALTRKFKSLERVINDPTTPDWIWLKLDALP